MCLIKQLSLVAAACALSACAVGPIHNPVGMSGGEKFVVSERAPDLYYRLTTSPEDRLECSQIHHSNYYQDRNEFWIYYGADYMAATMISNVVIGRADGNDTQIEVRGSQGGPRGSSIRQTLVNYIKTGKCV